MKPVAPLYGLGLALLASGTLAQRTVFTTTTTTITELISCVTTQYTTTVLDYCPCSAVFPSVTPCVDCSVCSTTTISPTPSPSGFTIDLTIPFSSGDQFVTLSRIGNTIGIGGQILVFNLSSTGVLRDTLTGDTVFVILPSGAIRKRFEGSVDLLIAPNPPASATIMTWTRTADGELLLSVGQNSANPITLGFGVALADNGSIDTAVPIQMYDLSEGLPTGVDDGRATQSFVTRPVRPTITITRTGSFEFSTTIFPTGTAGTVTIIIYKTATSRLASSTVSKRTFTITQYGDSAFTTTSTVAGGIVYIIIQSLQSTTTVTLFGSGATTTTRQFNRFDPIVTIFDIFSQVVTTDTIYGDFGFTSTPITGSRFPTITAIAQLSQVTVSNVTYGPVFSTISLQANTSAPTVTVFVQLTATTTITRTTYIFNQSPVVTTTLFGTLPTATVLVQSDQVRVFTTNTNSFDTTITIGPDNPTATVSVAINPTATSTLLPAILEWNFTTTSTETPSQSPGFTRTIRLHIPFPPASAIRFSPTDAAAGDPQYFAAATTSVLNQYNAWEVFSSATSRARFIQLENSLILATDPATGARLPFPALPWGFFPLSPNGSPIYFSLFPVDFANNPSAQRGAIAWNLVPGTQFLMLNQAFNQTFLIDEDAALWYDGDGVGPYSVHFFSTADALPVGTRVFKTVQPTMLSFTASAPTQR
ncbi:hypothetical protein DRE_00836 [Drechslerella stenobrocha 248]|uniref:Uncharacterized protein n=1 Tax=Drechslerella stenobrocha 248 TaxID=1043628 RepID=W7HZ22_9PEZI|nr:hypothetical protein DRE_00836 [Drechslerella stenobrocha 248]